MISIEYLVRLNLFNNNHAHFTVVTLIEYLTTDEFIACNYLITDEFIACTYT